LVLWSRHHLDARACRDCRIEELCHFGLALRDESDVDGIWSRLSFPERAIMPEIMPWQAWSAAARLAITWPKRQPRKRRLARENKVVAR
jgi:hypothetical protein